MTQPERRITGDPTGNRKAAKLANTQRGAAIRDGKIVRGTGDGYLIALDAKTGDLLWSRQIADPAKGYFISMPPLIVDDLVPRPSPSSAVWLQVAETSNSRASSQAIFASLTDATVRYYTRAMSVAPSPANSSATRRRGISV